MKTFVTEYGDEHGTLLKILLTLLDGPSSRGDNQLMNEVGFRYWYPDGEVFDFYGLGKTSQNTDEGKRQGVDVPFPNGYNIDFSSTRPMRGEFDLIPCSGKLLYPSSSHEADETEIGDHPFEVCTHLLLRVGEMDGEVNIQSAQQVMDTVQLPVQRHDPTADEQGAVEKTNLAQCTEQSANLRGKPNGAQDFHFLTSGRGNRRSLSR